MSDKDIFGRPLPANAPLRDSSSLSPKFLEEAGKLAVQEIQAEIRRASFKRLPLDLLRSFDYTVQGDQLVIRSDHPAAGYLNRGVRAYQMTHLTKARRPIPIVKDNGEVVFRSATKASMRDGKWRHPGFRGLNFIERGAKRALDTIRQQALEQTKREVAARFRTMMPKG